MFTAQHPFTPPASPPSSPTFPHTDPSPASSPSQEPFVLDDAPSTLQRTVAHPFAASTNATRRPRQYALREMPPPSFEFVAGIDLETRSKRVKLSQDVAMELDEDLCEVESVRDLVIDESAAYEQETWDEAIANVVDTGHGIIDLSGRNLTAISPQISELAHFVAIPENFERTLASSSANLQASDAAAAAKLRLFRRSTTAPADIISTRQRLFERTRSFNERPVGLAREELQLHLAVNLIREIPAQLFLLQRLTVLSLRSNRITFLPPSIARLTNLRELNLSTNQLKFLPAEILGLKLSCISLFPNPFLTEDQEELREDEADKGTIRGRGARKGENGDSTAISSTKIVQPHDGQVPELTELCLRVLISPAAPCSEDPDPLYGSSTESEASTNLTRYYDMTSTELAPHLRDVLNACVPGSVPEPFHIMPSRPLRPPRDQGEQEDMMRKEVQEKITGIGFCPSPRHNDGLGNLFVHHAEERFTWESVIGGTRLGGKVPLRWRGCMIGCLDYLGVEAGETDAGPAKPAVVDEADDGMDGAWEDGLGSGNWRQTLAEEEDWAD